MPQTLQEKMKFSPTPAEAIVGTFDDRTEDCYRALTNSYSPERTRMVRDILDRGLLKAEKDWKDIFKEEKTQHPPPSPQ